MASTAALAAADAGGDEGGEGKSTARRHQQSMRQHNHMFYFWGKGDPSREEQKNTLGGGLVVDVQADELPPQYYHIYEVACVERRERERERWQVSLAAAAPLRRICFQQGGNVNDGYVG